MKCPASLVAVALLIIAMPGLVKAQSYVLESQIVVTGSVLTQGPDASVSTIHGGTTITTNRVVNTSFTNREIISAMLTRKLIPSPVTGWNLVYLVDGTGTGGPYAQKTGQTAVAVPADLLTLPVFGPKVSGGMTVTAPSGGSFVSSNVTALATASISNVPACGLATSVSSTATITVDGKSRDINTLNTTLNFVGGTSDASGSRLVKGVLTVGSAKLSTLTTLP